MELRGAQEARATTTQGYVSQSADTPEDIDRLLFEHWAQLTGAEKLGLAMRASVAVREVCARGVQALYPEAGPEELRIRVAMRFYGEELVRELLGRAPGDAA